VKEEIVNEIAGKLIEEKEKEARTYIVEGFPKTYKQGLALKKMGILPDFIFILNQPRDVIK
jgi:adenylate kinase family enzyme